MPSGASLLGEPDFIQLRSKFIMIVVERAELLDAVVMLVPTLLPPPHTPSLAPGRVAGFGDVVVHSSVYVHV